MTTLSKNFSFRLFRISRRLQGESDARKLKGVSSSDYTSSGNPKSTTFTKKNPCQGCFPTTPFFNQLPPDNNILGKQKFILVPDQSCILRLSLLYSLIQDDRENNISKNISKNLWKVEPIFCGKATRREGWVISQNVSSVHLD